MTYSAKMALVIMMIYAHGDIHCESKNGATTILPITLPNVDQLSNLSLTDSLVN